MKPKTIFALFLLTLLVVLAVVALRLFALNQPAESTPRWRGGAVVLDQAADIQRQEIPLPTVTPEGPHSGCDGGLYFTSNPAKCLGPDGLRVANQDEPQPFVRQPILSTPQP